MPSLDDDKRIISDFLRRCNGYADERIAHYSGQLEGSAAAAALALQDKIGHWCAYRAFNEHALDELARGELDDWLSGG